jgi:uncharacterized Zn-binding protein involved in type VI secretion
MPDVGRTGQDVVGGKGIITGPGAPTVFVNGTPISVEGDVVAPHGKKKHAAAVIKPGTGSKTVFADGKPITLKTQTIATCLEPVTTGSPDVQAT